MSPILEYFSKKSMEITHKLLGKEVCYPGLLGGDLAWCIFLNESDIAKREEYIYRIIAKQIEYFNTLITPSSLDIYEGLGSLHLTIHFLGLSDILPAGQLKQLDQKLYGCFKNFINNNYYDFLYGSSGLLLCFIQSKTYIDKAIKAYIKGIWNIFKHDKNIDIYLPKSKIVNFGFAHGICAISQLLIFARSLSIEVEKVDRLLIAIGDSLTQRFIKKNDKTIVPATIDEDGNYTYTEILGWCTGRLCYGLALLNIGEITGIKKYTDFAKNILEDAIHISTETQNSQFQTYEKSIHTFSLCHGQPSRSLLFKLCYEKTHNIAFLTKHQEYHDFLINKFYLNDDLIDQYENNYSLLHGISGIFLTILSNNRQKWRELLLLF